MAKFNNLTKVITGVCTFSYLNCWDAKAINGGIPKFSVSLIIPKSGTRTIEKINSAIKAAFVTAYNKLVSEKAEITANAELIRRTLCDTAELQQEKSKLEDEMSVLVEMTQNIVAENARIAQDQEEYQKRYNGLVDRYNTAKSRYDEVAESIAVKEAQSERLEHFIRTLKAQDGILAEFDERLWSSMAEFVTVGRKKELTVTFRDGTEIMA